MLLFGRGFFFFFLSLGTNSTLLQTHWASVSLKSCPVWFVFVYVLTACVFVTRDTVRHRRRFVFGTFVRKPNCSWSEAFVNRGLTVYEVPCLGVYVISTRKKANPVRPQKELTMWNNIVIAFRVCWMCSRIARYGNRGTLIYLVITLTCLSGYCTWPFHWEY